MPPSSTRSPRYDRFEIVSLLEERRATVAGGQSERQFLHDAPIARSTLREEVARWQRIEADAATVTFFASPAGSVLLWRWVLAAHFVITLRGRSGITRFYAPANSRPWPGPFCQCVPPNPQEKAVA